MHFAGSGTDNVLFGRPIAFLYLTTSSSVEISFDGGSTFMALGNTTHVFPHPNTKHIFLRGGSWSGVGIGV